MTLLQSSFQCSRPFYDIIVNGRLFDWLACPYAIGGLGLTGVGMFILTGGFIGLKNWSESWIVPITWLGMITPFMASAYLLPGALLRLIAGLLTLAVTMLIIGAYWWFGRA